MTNLAADLGSRFLAAFNAIARWLADQVSSNEGLAESETGAAVLEFAEPPEQAAHVARTISAVAAVHRLAHGGTSDQLLTALIVTANGNPSETELRIIVVDDVPALLAAVRG